MQKKLPTTPDDTLHAKPRGVARPDIVGRDLEAAYRQMAQDEAREAEALEWAEATLVDQPS
jgi:hypothetical protein